MWTSPKSIPRASGLRELGTLALLFGAGCAEAPPVVPAVPATLVRPASFAGSRFGTNQWVECTAGDLPIVISVPHGGTQRPAAIPDRTLGSTVADANTIQLATALSAALSKRTGRAPYVIVNHLHRKKLDANREIEEAAQGNADAERAWREYHAFVDEACADVALRFGNGLYIDLHGHAHAVARVELGYLLTARELDLSDAELTRRGAGEKSSSSALLRSRGSDFIEVLRGPTSLGGFLSSEFACVPSPSCPSPGQDEYFNGGYSTRVHASAIPGVQIEAPLPGVRDTPENRARFGRSLAKAIESFLLVHEGIRL